MIFVNLETISVLSSLIIIMLVFLAGIQTFYPSPQCILCDDTNKHKRSKGDETSSKLWHCCLYQNLKRRMECLIYIWPFAGPDRASGRKKPGTEIPRPSPAQPRLNLFFQKPEPSCRAQYFRPKPSPGCPWPGIVLLEMRYCIH